MNSKGGDAPVKVTVRKASVTLSLLLILLFFGSLCGTSDPANAGTITIAKKKAGAGCTPTIAYVAMAESETPNVDGVNVPAGTSDGHFMIAGCISDTDEAMTMTGWLGLDGSGTPTYRTSSTSRLTAAYRIASSEPAHYHFTDATADDTCFIATFSTTCGTWHIQDFDSSAATAQTIDTTAVTAVNNSMLVVVFGDDDEPVLDDMPENYDMTRISDLSTSSRGIIGWYQAASAGDYTKTIDNTGYSHDLSTISAVLHAE